jgi:glycosyltransferase involved in cell wall biosynthesis
VTGRPIRAIVVLGTTGMGGAERQALWLAGHLAADPTLRVTVAAPGLHGAVIDRCAALGLPYHPLPLFESRRPTVCLARMLHAALALRRLRPDLLLPFTWPANVMCGLFRRAAGARWTLWNQRDAGLGRLVPGLERRATAGCSGFAANGPDGLSFLAGALGVPAAEIHLLRNALDLPTPLATRASWRTRLGLDDDRSAAVMVANLQRHKDHATLLEGWALLPRPRPVLVLAGRPDDTAASLRAQAVRLGIEEDLRWPGAVEDVAGLLGACDFGVFSSPSEGCPNGLIEMLAAGLPCVASDIAGVRFAAGGGGALLVPAGDPTAFAGAVRRLLADGRLRADLAAGARAAAAAFAPQPALVAACATLRAATRGQWQPA